MSRKRKILLWLLAGAGGLVIFAISRSVCISAYLFDGIAVPMCPDGELTQTVSLESYGLRRGTGGSVYVSAAAHYTTAAADQTLTAPVVRGLEASVYLVKADGTEEKLAPKKSWEDEGDRAHAVITLPEVPDGEYTLRAKVKTPIGDTTQDVPLPVFAPAKIHVLTDRPLYEPGNTVQFRVVALRAKDLLPLNGRPGRWIVTDPNNETVLEEKAPAGPFGITSGSFPLDQGAAIGEWHVRWVSGAAEDNVTFRVEPFTLPRFSIEANPAKPFYRANEKPVVRGRVVYSSGAPVRDAELEITWGVNGNWPPPTEWMQSTLPKHANTDHHGGFELELPRVPGDLRGRNTLWARIVAIDPAKDRVEGGTSVLLSEDAIQVSAVTELDEGLVQGFNNRIYLRVTSAGGAVLRDTELTVKRAWEPNDKGVQAITDVDGVAALQVDPGPPINVVIPPMPFRPPPRPPAIARTNAIDLVADESAPLADLRAMDSWNAALVPCTRFIESNETLQLAVHADPAGTIDGVIDNGRPFGRCASAIVRDKRLAPTGRHRVYQLEFNAFADLPTMDVNIEGTPMTPPALEAALHLAALEARTCLPRTIESGSLGRMMIWKYDAKKRELATKLVAERDTEGTAPAAVISCVETKLAHLPIVWPKRGAEDAESEDDDEQGGRGTGAIGVARFTVAPAPSDASVRPQAMTMLGYELAVVARTKSADGKTEELGKTKLFLNPGNVPFVRLRATPVLAAPGQDVEVAILRGLNFNGEIPEKLYLAHEKGAIEGKVDPKTRVVHFKIPEDRSGWFSVDFSGARALVYVKPSVDLEVAVKPGADQYAPGDNAVLTVSTTSNGKGAPAAVGLFGVDQSLAQLAALPGPDDMARVRPHADMRSNAFDVLDAAALALGRIRGANAAAATIQRVATVPAYVDLDAEVSVSGAGLFDPLAPLTDHFYEVLAELHEQTRSWEEKAPPEEQMHPELMARLWQQALDACEAKKIPVTDAYGRKLKLHRLPADLLALTDPRAVVVRGTRLPEDVENWPAWVAKERP